MYFHCFEIVGATAILELPAGILQNGSHMFRRQKKRTSCHELSRSAAFQPTGCSTVAGYGWIIHDPGTRTPACKPLLHLKAMSSCIKRWQNYKFLAFYEHFIGHCQQSLPYLSYFVIVVVMITEAIVLQPTPPVACFDRMILSAQGKMGRGRF